MRSGNSIIDGCVFDGNDGPGLGVSWGSYPIVSNSIFVNNNNSQSGNGGAISCEASSLDLYNCTITQNNAKKSGSAIYLNGGVVNLYNSIVVDNAGAEIVANGTINAYNTLSSFTNWSNANDKNVVNYLYDPDKPLFVNSENQDFSLTKDSQALNLGAKEYVNSEYDVCGNVRISQDVVDLGAWEGPSEYVGNGYVVHLGEEQNVTNRNFGAYNEDSGVNNKPTIASTAPTQACYGDLYRYDVKAYDGDGDELKYELLASPEGMTIHPQLGVIVWTPSAEQIGSTQAIVKVSDGRGGVATQMFVVTVASPNNAPVITTDALPRQILAGAPFQADISAQDADGDAISFALGGNVPTGVTIDSATGRLAWTPVLSAVSETPYEITVVVTDARGASSEKTYAVQVVSELPNDSPAISSTPRTRTRFDLDYFYLVQASDPNGDPLTYALSKAPKGMAIDSASGLVSWKPDSSNAGSHEIEIVVSDGRGGTAVQAFTLDVVSGAENSAPQIVSNPNLIAMLGKTYTYAAKAYDPEGDLVMWRLEEAPEGMSVDYLTGEIFWTPTSAQRGSHKVVLRVIDSYGASSRQTFEVNVRGLNRPPVIVSSPSTEAYVGETYVYAAQARDEDGDAATFSLVSAPDGMTIDAQTGVIIWTPTAEQTGKVSVYVRAQDEFGGLDVQRFNIEVVDKNLNFGPTITSSPIYAISAGHKYSYAVSASDPENDPLTYALVSAPNGMTIDAQTGEISWTTKTNSVGTYVVTVSATDQVVNESGELQTHLAAYQTFPLVVRRNQEPKITSTPNKTATAGGSYVYAYDVVANDPDGDAMTFTLLSGPKGMTIDSLGRLRWTPEIADMGKTYDVSIQVSDEFGGSAIQNYSVEVQRDETAPVVRVSATRTLANIGDSVEITVQASDNTGVESVTLFVDGKELALTASGQNTYKTAVAFDKSGMAEIYASASDYSGNVGKSESVSVRVFDPTDGDCPEITIHAFIPQVYDSEQGKLVDGERVEGDELLKSPTFAFLTDVEISIFDENMAEWRVEYAPISLVQDDVYYSSKYTTLASGVGVLEHARFQIDATMLANDLYYLRIVAYDVNGNGWIAPVSFAVAGAAKLGQFSFSMTDISLFYNGISINVTRTYDTLNADKEGDFGYGWTMSVSDPKIVETTQKDSEMENGDRVYITTPEGERIGFTYAPKTKVHGGLFVAAIEYTPNFDADKGVKWTLAPKDSSSYMRGGTFGSIIGALDSPWNPNEYILTSPEGVKYEYSQVTGLKKITDANGNVVSVTRDGLAYSDGTGIVFERDSRGRIITVRDGMDAVTYSYDKDGNLLSYSNQIDAQSGMFTQTYRYMATHAHFLDEIYDLDNVRIFKTEFDDSGRLVGSVDALGNVTQKEFDPGALAVTSKDANGNVVVYWYDDNGNITKESVQGIVNVLTGEVSEYSKTYEYSDVNNPTKETRVVYYDGSVDEAKYDVDGNLLELVKYDTSGNVVSVSNYRWNNDGKISSLSNVEEGTFDFAVGTTIIEGKTYKTETLSTPNGLSIVSVVDSMDRVILSYDLLGNRVDYEYRGTSNVPYKTIRADHSYSVCQTDSKDNIISIEEYDSSNQLLYQVSAEYDSLNRVISETKGTSRIEYEYYGSTSKVTKETVTNLNDSSDVTIAHYFYDKNENLIRQVDPNQDINNSESGTFFEYDKVGNRTLVRDSLGNETRYEYDALGQVVREIDPLGGETLYVYDQSGNISDKVDRNGRRIKYEYDLTGNLLSERWYQTVDSVEPVYSLNYQYDSLGQVISIQDNNTSYSIKYEGLTTVITIDYLFDDLSAYVITYQVDDFGYLQSITDENAVSLVLEYDQTTSLMSSSYLTGVGIEEARADFDYTVGGLVSLISYWNELERNNLAGSAEYNYETSGRLKDIVFRSSLSEVLTSYEYEYDAVGFISREILKSGDSALNRVADYSYDATGQLLAAVYSNAQENEYFSYDENGNRTNYGYETGIANCLLSDGTYKYVYDAEGNMISKTRLAYVSGEVNHVEYHYDHRNRLIQVDNYSSDPAEGGVLLDTESYVYNALNQRIAVRHGDTVVYSIYSGDRLWKTCDSNGLENRFIYDPNGNIIFTYQNDGNSYWSFIDQIGSVRDLVYYHNQKHEHFDYTAFGLPYGKTESVARFVGQSVDAFSQLIWYKNRFYSPEVGRFISQDPYGFDAGDSNLYRYCMNSPVSLTDANGTCCITIALLTDLWKPMLALIGYLHGYGVASICYISNYLQGTEAGLSDQEILKATIMNLMGYNYVKSFNVVGQTGLKAMTIMFDGSWFVPVLSQAAKASGILGSYFGGFGACNVLDMYMSSLDKMLSFLAGTSARFVIPSYGGLCGGIQAQLSNLIGGYKLRSSDPLKSSN